VVLTLAGELLRLWAVHHIGAISRTRSERLGPLVATGPFAVVRNPLYIGNTLLWVGFALSARLVWLAPAILVLLALEYHAIVRWEEQLLEARRGREYRDYCARVPRWLPDFQRAGREAATGTPDFTDGPSTPPAFSWRETFFSERGTLIAIGAGFVLLWLKSRL
jgi:hypothetical protein